MTLPGMCASVSQVIYWRVVLGAIVGPIVRVFVPIVSELVLRFPAAQPVDMHVHHLDTASDNGVIGESDGC